MKKKNKESPSQQASRYSLSLKLGKRTNVRGMTPSLSNQHPLRESIHEGWIYLKGSKEYILGAAAFFFVCIYLGFEYADKLTFFDTVIAQMRESIGDLRGVELSQAIFLSNTQSAFFSLFLGIAFSVFSLFNILLNGSLIGYVLHYLWIETGSTHFWKLIPHGIFELPALFISWGLGIKCGWELIRVYFSQYSRKSPLRTLGVWGIGLFVVGVLMIAFSAPSLVSASFHNRSSSDLPLLPTLSFALGFFLCALSFITFFVFSIVEKKMRKDYWRECVYPSFLVFMWYVIPLLIVAGIIEGVLITLFN